MNTLCRFVIINKLFPTAIGSQRNSTLISYKKRFQEETAVEKYVQNAMIEITFVTNLMKLFLVLEAVKFNSSMEPNNVSEFTWLTCFNTKLDVFTKCFTSVAEI